MRTNPALVVAAVVVGAQSLPAQALHLELSPNLQARIQRDDNLFRAPDNPPRGSAPKVGDTITRVGGGAKLKLEQSLQRLELSGDYQRNDYRDQSQLDHDSYQVGARANLRLGSTLSLDLAASRDRRLENFAFRDDAAKGFLRLDTSSADLAYAITPRYSLVARADYLATRATLRASQDFDVTERGQEAAVRYQTAGFSRLEFALRNVDGEFPKRRVTAGDGREKAYTQQSAQLRVGYIPSGLTDIALQIGYTRRTHDDPLVEDFSGVTGRGSVLRRISGRTQVRMDVFRNLFYVEEVGANYVENLGAAIGGDYLYSSKLRLGGTLERVQSRYRGSDRFTLLGDDGRKDNVTTLRLGAEYRPIYRLSVIPEFRTERRSSPEQLSSYRYQSVGLDLVYRYGDQPEVRF